MITRREFLFDCSAISVAALAVPTRALAEAALPLWRQKSLEDLSCEAFAGQLNTPFRIHAAPATFIQVKLDKVRRGADQPLKPGQRPAGDAGNEKFALVFSGRRSDLLRQNTYTFEHKVLGRFDLFVVPIFTRNPNKINYEIVFNRPRKRGPARGQVDARDDVPHLPRGGRHASGIKEKQIIG